MFRTRPAFYASHPQQPRPTSNPAANSALAFSNTGFPPTSAIHSAQFHASPPAAGPTRPLTTHSPSSFPTSSLTLLPVEHPAGPMPQGNLFGPTSTGPGSGAAGHSARQETGEGETVVNDTWAAGHGLVGYLGRVRSYALYRSSTWNLPPPGGCVLMACVAVDVHTGEQSLCRA